MPVHPGTCVGNNPEHWLVFAKCMDKDQADILVARMRDRVLKQSCSVTSPTGVRQDRHAKFSTGVADVTNPIRKVGHGNQQQAAVKNPKNLVMIKVETCDILFDLLILREIAKAQEAVARVQGNEVAGN